MPEENRVFDVAKPGHGSPQATSKPIIVGHSPTMSDPMVRGDTGASAQSTESMPTKIDIQDKAQDEPKLTVIKDEPEASEDKADSWSGQFGENSTAEAAPMPEIETTPEPEPTPSPEPSTEPEAAADSQNQPPSPADTQDPIMPTEQLGHVEGLHVSPPPKKSPLLWILLILLVLIIGSYLVLDSGVVKTSIKLPFHVFKQKTVVVTPPATTSTQSTAPVLPAGFTQYKIANTTVTFAAPTAWGAPTSNTDPGYTVRDATNKSTGTHAYIVTFATNKDIEVAVTSSKYLPAARAVQYYDFLQWCLGTNDSKTYLGVLNFTTANKVDTATTVSCDQGPLTDVTKLNATTIAELKVKDTTGAVVGDLYTKNITGGDLVVFRVKDKAMTNSTQIKQLLNTVKATATTSTNSSASQ